MEIKLKKAKDALLNHKVIAFPTETVCGLGVYFDDEEAYHLLNKIKGRPEDKPYTMMLSDVSEIFKYAYVDENALKIINAFMPGPITVLLKVKDNVPSWVTHNTNKIGIRVPNHPQLQNILRYMEKPLLVPSANKSNCPPLSNMEEVKKIFGSEIEFYFDDDANNEKPSTIVDLCDTIKIIREGQISKDDINNAIKENTMKISIGCDHGGLNYKEQLKEFLKNNGYEVIDCGTNDNASCHYPIFAEKAARYVSSKECEFGILICTSGEGVCIAANKIDGVRCGIGYNDDVSRLLRQHNDANMIAFGQAFMDIEDVKKRCLIFLNTKFEGGRHQVRVDLINNLEK